MTTVRRDPVIDFLRGVCILYIVGYWHLVPYTQAFPGYATFITEAVKDTALGIFVFCSGYLLAVRDVSLAPVALGAFYRRRVLRIYPLYLLALLLFAALGLAGSADILQAALLISMFSPPAPYTLWFITMIMAFYLLAPFLIRAAESLGLFALVVISLMVLIYLYHYQVTATDVRMTMFLPAFAFGVLFARQARVQSVLRAGRWLLLIGLVPAYLLFAQQVGATYAAAVGRIPLILVGTAVAFLFAGPVARLVHAPILYWLSYASFGLYLFHRVVFKFAIDLYFPAGGWERLLYLLGLVLPLAIVLAYVIQKAYDRVLDRLESRSG